MTQTRSITIFGATGSVGESTLNLVRECNGRFRLKGLTANSNHQELSRLALEFKPELVVIADDAYYQPLADSLTGTGIEVRAGRQALVELARELPRVASRAHGAGRAVRAARLVRSGQGRGLRLQRSGAKRAGSSARETCRAWS